MSISKAGNDGDNGNLEIGKELFFLGDQIEKIIGSEIKEKNIKHKTHTGLDYKIPCQ